MQSIGKIGVIMPEISDPLDYELLRGIQAQAFRLGYDVIVYSGVYNGTAEAMQTPYAQGLQNIYSLVQKSELSGVIFSAGRFQGEETMQQTAQMLSQVKFPCLVLDKSVFPFHSIYPRQEESIFRLTEHLIRDHGCKKLYCITGYPNEPNSDERTAGFCRAMQMNGLQYNSSDIIYGQFWKDIPCEIGKQIADGTLEKPDGIVCASDVMAAALCESLTGNGVRVPEDICVTGYDGSWDAWMHFPRITTITGRDRQFGEDAVLRLAEMMTGISQGYSAVTQEIRYGDSCGCKHLHEQTESVDQLVAERCFIQTILRSRQKKTNYTSDLIDRLRGASTLDEWITAADRVGHILLDWKWLDLCLCADWCMDFEHPELRRRSGFPDEMILAFSKRRDHNEPSCHFPTGDILPALSQPHEPQFVLLTSLHAKGQIFGYLAAAYDSPDDIGLDEYFINWCDAAANGLAGVQERMYLAYQKQQVELLTVHDPATGLYNRRGLAELLPQSLKNAKQNGEQLILFLLTVANRNDTAAVDPILLTANALRIAAPESAVCAKATDRVFALMFPLETSQNESETCEQIILKTEVQMRELLGNTAAAVPQLVTVSHRLDSMSLSEAAGCIRDAAKALTDRANAEANYYFDYKEELLRLHREIISEPQREWSIQDMADRIGISRSHLQRLYKQLFGVSCRDDLINLRMEKAKQLLTYTDLRIHEIADQCGYQNESHFMRQFKEKVGKTALQYRADTKK